MVVFTKLDFTICYKQSRIFLQRVTAIAVINTNMAGKGSRRRPTNIPLEQADANFEGIFGKRVPTYLKKMIPDEPTNDSKEDKPKEEGKE
jgi:hypothetical protein